MKTVQSTRRAAARYRYSVGSASGFIEVVGLLSPDELKRRLLEVPCVIGVQAHHKGSKTSQGNIGDHWQETNWEVFVHGYKKTLEFEVTKNDHMSEIATRGLPPTRTVMFKDPQKDMRQIAWKILMRAVGDIAAFPVHVLSWYSDIFGNITWEVYQDDRGELWWHQDLMPGVAIVPSATTEWAVYQSPHGGRLWALHEPSGYWSFL